jgi:hypothetical protein
MTDPAIHKTYVIRDLLRTPCDERGEGWLGAFHDSIVDAAMMAADDTVIGSDGFPYLALCLPEDGDDFVPHSIGSELDRCTNEGAGIAVFTDWEEEPNVVFSYGDLWSLRAHGHFYGDPVDAEQAEIDGLPDDTHSASDDLENVMMGKPSEEYFPNWARQVIGRYMQKAMRIRDPQALLMLSVNAHPQRNLVFNIWPDLFPDEEAYEQALCDLEWYLPHSKGLAVVSRDYVVPEAMVGLLPGE